MTACPKKLLGRKDARNHATFPARCKGAGDLPGGFEKRYDGWHGPSTRSIIVAGGRRAGMAAVARGLDRILEKWMVE